MDLRKKQIREILNQDMEINRKVFDREKTQAQMLSDLVSPQSMSDSNGLQSFKDVLEKFINALGLKMNEITEIIAKYSGQKSVAEQYSKLMYSFTDTLTISAIWNELMKIYMNPSIKQRTKEEMKTEMVSPKEILEKLIYETKQVIDDLGKDVDDSKYRENQRKYFVRFTIQYSLLRFMLKCINRNTYVPVNEKEVNVEFDNVNRELKSDTEIDYNIVGKLIKNRETNKYYSDEFSEVRKKLEAEKGKLSKDELQKLNMSLRGQHTIVPIGDDYEIIPTQDIIDEDELEEIREEMRLSQPIYTKAEYERKTFKVWLNKNKNRLVKEKAIDKLKTLSLDIFGDVDIIKDFFKNPDVMDNFKIFCISMGEKYPKRKKKIDKLYNNTFDGNIDIENEDNKKVYSGFFKDYDYIDNIEQIYRDKYFVENEEDLKRDAESDLTKELPGILDKKYEEYLARRKGQIYSSKRQEIQRDIIDKYKKLPKMPKMPKMEKGILPTLEEDKLGEKSTNPLTSRYNLEKEPTIPIDALKDAKQRVIRDKNTTEISLDKMRIQNDNIKLLRGEIVARLASVKKTVSALLYDRVKNFMNKYPMIMALWSTILKNLDNSVALDNDFLVEIESSPEFKRSYNLYAPEIADADLNRERIDMSGLGGNQAQKNIFRESFLNKSNILCDKAIAMGDNFYSDADKYYKNLYNKISLRLEGRGRKKFIFDDSKNEMYRSV